MKRITTPAGVTVSYQSSGRGPALVLVHGAFSDHSTNWMYVEPLLRDSFSLHAIARRGRGETDATVGHSLPDEVSDVTAVIESIGEPVFLLGHSYGAHCALAAAARVPQLVRKLVLYEPGWPSLIPADALERLEAIAVTGDLDGFATSFFRDVLLAPADVLEAMRGTDDWAAILADANATRGDLRAFSNYEFDANDYRDVRCPVLLQVGSDSPRDLYVTDALAAVLPDARIEELSGQAHEGMTTAPEMYAQSVKAFLLGSTPSTGSR